MVTLVPALSRDGVWIFSSIEGETVGGLDMTVTSKG